MPHKKLTGCAAMVRNIPPASLNGSVPKVANTKVYVVTVKVS